MKDSTKITLTIGQLRKLVKEASDETDAINKPDDGKSDVPEFEIKDGALTKYNGPGGEVVIPKGVTVISGWYEKDDEKKTMLLYGASGDYGEPALEFLSRIPRSLKGYAFYYAPDLDERPEPLDLSSVEWI